LRALRQPHNADRSKTPRTTIRRQAGQATRTTATVKKSGARNTHGSPLLPALDCSPSRASPGGRLILVASQLSGLQCACRPYL